MYQAGENVRGYNKNSLVKLGLWICLRPRAASSASLEAMIPKVSWSRMSGLPYAVLAVVEEEGGGSELSGCNLCCCCSQQHRREQFSKDSSSTTVVGCRVAAFGETGGGWHPICWLGFEGLHSWQMERRRCEDTISHWLFMQTVL